MAKLRDVVTVLSSPEAWAGLITWPVFSVTSFAMLRALRRQGLRPRTFLDVGANSGQFSVAAANLFPESTILAFEANPSAAATLAENCRRYPQVTAFSVALGSERGRCRLNINSHSQSTSLLKLGPSHSESFPGAREVNAAEVEVITLDEALGGRVLQPPILLKVDVQGYEAKVLQGALQSLQRIEYVILEASFREMYVGETLFTGLLEMMSAAGFSFLRPVGWLEDPITREILQCDALFAQTQRIEQIR